MRLSEVWRTTTFRLSVVYGLLFAVGMVALLAMVYVRSAVYLTHRVDDILAAEAAAQVRVAPAALKPTIDAALTINGRNSVFALFAPDGTRETGNLSAMPAGLVPGGRPVEIPATAQFPVAARLIAKRLPSGEVLVVGRDINQLRQIRRIIASALIWSGGLIILAGLAGGTALSLGPIRRLRRLQAASHDIAAGNLMRRMPSSARGDELDMFADTVNHMLGEVERLMSEVRASSETIAHDLRTPLTRARSQLHRLEQAPSASPDQIAQVTAELDEVLERFVAILRLSELETRARSAGFAATDLDRLLRQVAELYQPLAEEAGVRLSLASTPGVTVEADAKLLFEAVSNLVDNAIKFTGDREGYDGEVRLAVEAEGPRIVVQDNGPGVPDAERSAVLQRFYRSERDRLTPGSGLGLSIVAAIVRMHRFRLELQDAAPGLRCVIDCGARP
ncbi:HAMP domain-containing sensor histidine kinase [Phenylobacterium sp.]|uniref:sensor histidine kinase n=1 Tax=Phenylobacterium sp. TaxID=1871053 RepID=UPI001202DC55|nr:HAMP domain-containing sensor histidine kinase [Phenylobacterium sp.]THD61338.1 MAG: HAMP domain-containing histidine kinase [Phenylobacterium sp.]